MTRAILKCHEHKWQNRRANFAVAPQECSFSLYILSPENLLVLAPRFNATVSIVNWFLF